MTDQIDGKAVGDLIAELRGFSGELGVEVMCDEAAARLTALLAENEALEQAHDTVAGALAEATKQNERLRAEVERRDAALRLVQKRLDSAAEAAGNGAEKCEPAERDTYLVFRDHMLGISKIARAALSPARKGDA